MYIKLKYMYIIMYIRESVIVTKEDDKKITINEGEIFFIPAWKLLLKPELKNLI